MAFLPPDLAADIKGLTALYPEPASALLPALKLVQRQYRWVPPEAMSEVGEILGVYPSQVEDVVSFYALFFDRPTGKYVIDVCTNIACHLVGGVQLLEHLEERLGIKSGETTADGLFTLRDAECLAACGTAPVLEVNQEMYENVSPEMADALIERLRSGIGPTYAEP
jgi:NADH-quinone oxidoreductase subunit E